MSKTKGSGIGRCRKFSQIVQAVWFVIHRAKPRAISAQKLRSCFGLVAALARQVPKPTNITAKPAASEKNVSPGPLDPLRQTTAKARVNPAAATNQRWRLSRLIRPNFMRLIYGNPRTMGQDRLLQSHAGRWGFSS